MGLHTGNAHDWGFAFLGDAYFDRAIKFLKGWETEFLSETEWIQLIFFITTPSKIRIENIGFTTPEDTRENRYQSPPPKVVLPAN